MSVAPWNATGASSVGGTPAIGPVALTHDGEFSRKFVRPCVSGSAMYTIDNGLRSISRLALYEQEQVNTDTSIMINNCDHK